MTYYNTAKITGRVFLDQNGDNTEHNGSGGYESGIAGQTVKLLNSSGQVIATTTTSSNGTYTFSNLPGGYYTVLFPTSIGDLSLVEQDVGSATEDSDANVNTGKTATICLNNGQCLSNVDAGYADLTTEDGTVEGSGGNDVIDVAYTGDPDGDMVDNNDAILPGDTGDDDLIYAYGGDDLVKAGAGDDEVYGGYGNDEIYTGSGNDTAFGENGADTLVGGSGDDELYGGGQNDVIIGDGADMESGVSYDGKVLVWDNVAADGTCLGSSTNHNVGGINVNIGFQGQDYGAIAQISNETVYVESGEGMDSDSSLKLYGLGGEGGWDNTSTTTLNFSATNGSYEDDVENVAFRINDIDLATNYGDDHIDRVTVLAYDAAGNVVEVVLTPELTGQTVNGNTATGTVEHNSGVTPAAQMGSLLVTIAGPVSKIVIDYDNGGGTDQQVNVTDVTFDAVTITDVPDGAAGSDVLYGGAGDDIIQGNDEDDTLYGGTGNDTLEGGNDDDVLHGDEGNDRLIGGDGDDELNGGDGSDVILGGAGNDVADGGADGDEIWVGSGNDSVVGGEGNDWIHGQTGNDVLDGGDDDDMLFGEQGDDTLIGGAGDDLLKGGDDADYIYGGAGDTVDGGTGGNDNDTLDLTGQGPFYIENETVDADGDSTSGTIVFVDGAGDPTGETLTFTEIEKIIGDEINRGPNANDDAITVDEDSGPTTIDVLANDSDPDGDDLTITEATVPADQGSVDIIGGELVFTPAENFNGEATITYTVSDGNGGTDTATVTVTVNPVNDDPVANDDTAETDEDTPVTIPVLDNDTDVDGDDLTVTEATSPDGEVTINGDGTITFTPAPDFNGEATITYTVSDGNGGTDTATVTVTVNSVNDGPDAVDDSDTTDFNTAVTVDLLANDTDPEDDPLTVTGATLISGEGDIVDNGDGTVTFTPAMGFSGDAVIEYTISDGNGGTDTATHTITVGEAPLDGTVNGTDGDDIIDGGYLGDPEGDRVDNEDALIPGHGPNDDLIEAYGGNDTILAGQGNDTVYGGDGDDSILGQSGNDTLYGEDGEDIITGGKDDETIFGGADNDVLDGDSGNDSIEGNSGDDSILGGGGDDIIRGGTGNDTIDGENNDDMIFGGAGDDDLSGGFGDDKIEGGSGDDTLDGGAGNDDLWGASGDDTVYGGTGHDTIATAEGNDEVYGGDGNDIIDTANDENPLTGQNLPDQAYPGVYPADLDPNDDLDTVFGGAGNDSITTGDDDDTIFGGEGRDVIDAGIDDDLVYGGADNDTVIGSEGNDEIYGEDGNDVIYGGLVTPGPADELNLPDDLDGDGDSNDPGEDLVTDNNNDTLFGGAGDDTIYGADDDDTLYGGTGNDYLDGGVDDDIIEGGDGEDTIIGGQGNDEMFGGLGSDTFLGGNGGDHVVGGEDPDLDGDGQSDETDVLDLTGSGVDFITYVDGDPEAGTVTFLDGSTMTFEEIENVIPCFTPGTTIATPKGERLVEELREGDRIITRDNGIQEIRWVGRKEVTGKQLVKNPHLKPILVKAGALGNGLPERDMLVSPNHRMLVASDQTQLYFEEREVLAAAKHLVGTQGIHALDVMQTTYIHFMFDRHEVVLSNGAWTESFQPGDYSLKGIGNSQRNEIFELFPELASKPGLEGYQSARRALKKHEAKLLVK